MSTPILDDTLDLAGLSSWLRSLGAPRWQDHHVEAALGQLTRLVDLRTAVAYLEHLAQRNAYLLQFITSNEGDDVRRDHIYRAVGSHPICRWDNLPLQGDELTLDELITSALAAENALERSITFGQAARSGLDTAQVVCVLHGQVMDFGELVRSHLAHTDMPPDRDPGEEQLRRHGIGDVLRATAADLKAAQTLQRRNRKRSA